MAGGLYVSSSAEKYGPIFDGRAELAVEEFEAAVTRDAAEIGRDWIRIAAMGMDKSGKATGAAAAGVGLFPITGGWRIFGAMEKGHVWWPWLEGVSKRNVGSKFKGYHAFRATTFKLRKQMPAIAELRLREYLPKMGGEVI